MGQLAEGGNEGADRAEVVVLPRETFDAVRSFVSSVTTAGTKLLGRLEGALEEGPEG